MPRRKRELTEDELEKRRAKHREGMKKRYLENKKRVNEASIDFAVNTLGLPNDHGGLGGIDVSGYSNAKVKSMLFDMLIESHLIKKKRNEGEEGNEEGEEG
jgi:hypothetical protein